MSEIYNYYNLVKGGNIKKNDKVFKSTGLTLPFRILEIGSSGSGKNNLLMDIIKKTSGSFEQITIICRNTNQPLYDILKNKCPDIEFIEVQDGREIPKVEDYPKDIIKLIVFDDLITLKDQNIILDWFIRGRHSNASLIYLTQSFYSSNKELKRLRLQLTNIYILKVPNTKDLNMILSELSLGLEKKQLQQYYKDATSHKFNFLNIDVLNNQIKKNYKYVFTSF